MQSENRLDTDNSTLDIDINFEELEQKQGEAPVVPQASAQGDPVLRALEQLPPDIRERAARGIFGGVDAANVAPQPVDRLAEVTSKIGLVETKMLEAQQNGDTVTASTALAEYIKLQGDLAREQALQEIRPEIEKVRASVNAPYMLQQVKAKLAAENRYFKYYEKDFEANLRTVLERVPAAGLNQQVFEEAALMAEAVAFRKFAIEQEKKRGIPDKDPATGRFVPGSGAPGKKTQAEVEREEFRHRVYPELVEAQEQQQKSAGNVDKPKPKWYDLSGN